MGFTVPVAVTLALIGPRSTFATSNRNTGAAPAEGRRWTQKAPPPSPAATMAMMAAVFQTFGPREIPRAGLASTMVIGRRKCTARAVPIRRIRCDLMSDCSRRNHLMGGARRKLCARTTVSGSIVDRHDELERLNEMAPNQRL